jgi:hypothetical protein
MNQCFVLPSSLCPICTPIYAKVFLSGPCPSSYPPKFCTLFLCCTCATWPILIDLIVLTISHDKWYKPQNFSIPFFSQPHPITSFLLGPNIISTQFSNHHHNVQNVKLFVNCTATLLIQPRLGKFSMPWWYTINADTVMIYCVHTKLDQWESSQQHSCVSKLISTTLPPPKKNYDEYLITYKKTNGTHI